LDPDSGTACTFAPASLPVGENVPLYHTPGAVYHRPVIPHHPLPECADLHEQGPAGRGPCEYFRHIAHRRISGPAGIGNHPRGGQRKVHAGLPGGENIPQEHNFSVKRICRRLRFARPQSDFAMRASFWVCLGVKASALIFLSIRMILSRSTTLISAISAQ
jgi:hypothetical protein